MSETYYLSLDNPQVTTNCIAFIREGLASGDGLRVTVSNKKEERSQAQRRLQWKWYTQIAVELGEDNSVIRNRMMYKFGVPIFYRDNIEVNGVYSADTIDAIRQVKACGMIPHYEQLMRDFVARITSNSFSVKQNTEYLKAVDQWAIEKNIRLFVPADCEVARYDPDKD